MRSLIGGNPYIRRILTVFLSLALLFSFGLHALQVPHVHYGEAHDHGGQPGSGVQQLGEYMHLAEKKMFIAVFVGALAPWTFLASYILREKVWRFCLQMQWVTRFRTLLRSRAFLFEYLRLFFRKGVLHTKVF